MPSEKKLVGLRLDDATYAQLAARAAAESRTVANMAELLVKRGLSESQAKPPAINSRRARR